MRYLSFSVSAEGATDNAFLWQILFRTIALVIRQNGIDGIELSEGQSFFPRERNEERAARICRDKQVHDIFFVHFDAARNSKARLLETLFRPVVKGAFETCGVNPARVIPVCTVCEMEAWILTDPDAIAIACGYEAGWPRTVELFWNPLQTRSLPDPKLTLRSAFGALRKVDHLSADEQIETLEGASSVLRLDRLESIDEYNELKSDILSVFRVFGCYDV